MLNPENVRFLWGNSTDVADGALLRTSLRFLLTARECICLGGRNFSRTNGSHGKIGRSAQIRLSYGG